jgi:hypothetical protein
MLGWRLAGFPTLNDAGAATHNTGAGEVHMLDILDAAAAQTPQPFAGAKRDSNLCLFPQTSALSLAELIFLRVNKGVAYCNIIASL